MHRQGAEGLAQQVHQVLGGLGASGVHQQPAGLAVQVGAGTARAGEGAGQEVQQHLVLHLAPLLAPHRARLAVLDLGDLLVQGLRHHGGGQQPFLAADADQNAIAGQVAQGAGLLTQGRDPAHGRRLQGTAGAEAPRRQLGLATIQVDRGRVVQLEETEVLEHGIDSGAKGGGLSAHRRRLQARVRFRY